MKKIAAITFHSSYNFGSNLQAYALQEYIKKISENSILYNILNLRNEVQKNLYQTPFKKLDKKSLAKRLIYFKEKSSFDIKAERYENFINNYLNITEEYNSLEELRKIKMDYDYYISGSDQIWNLQALDFDWSYFLEFVNKGKKISYAASFGPKSQNFGEAEKERIKKDLMMYDHISVREQGSFDNVKSVVDKEVSMNVDPTMLLNKEEWLKIIPNNKIRDKEYILLYNLQGKKETYEIAKKVAKILKLPIVVPNETIDGQLFCDFDKKYDSGPLEFLNLLNNAELVLSSSFHGTVFSILLNKPFYSINGLKDYRINTLLKKMHLEDRSIEIDNIDEKVKKAFEIDFEFAEKTLIDERKKSEKYLKKALDLN